ncbi:MAG: hypothetical protein U1E51_01985 [Candidatus Binatia bacterium]|nr:hypothetical protein [Candidatus Binatia bacterium]
MKGRKRKGTTNEHRSAAWLRQEGYIPVRCAGSFGVWDLIGFSPSGILLVQVKTARWPGTKATRAMRRFPAPDNCWKLVHRWQPYAREPEVKFLFPPQKTMRKR